MLDFFRKMTEFIVCFLVGIASVLVKKHPYIIIGALVCLSINAIYQLARKREVDFYWSIALFGAFLIPLTFES